MKVWEMIEKITENNDLVFTFPDYRDHEQSIKVMMIDLFNSGCDNLVMETPDEGLVEFTLHKYLREVEYTQLPNYVSFVNAIEHMKLGNKAEYKSPNGDVYEYEMIRVDGEFKLQSVASDFYDNFFDYMLNDVWVLN